VSHLHLDLDHAPESAPAARRGVSSFLRAQWPEWCGTGAGRDLLDDVELVVSELVGNAVRHGIAPLWVEVDATVLAPPAEATRNVRIACHDGGPWDGTPSDPHSGRGFVIVRGLATDVRIDADAGHTTVIATLTRP
jgi:anti-sigma regulatory factor (Ser/Thr protein kinase)